jgi:hypothetical protein
VVSGGDGLGRADYESILLDPPALYREQVELGKKLTVADRVVILHALLDSPPEAEGSREVVRSLRDERAVLDGALVVGGANRLRHG